VLGSDELADDCSGQGKPDIDPQHRNDPGQAEGHDKLAKHLEPRGAKRIEQLLAIGIERLDAGICRKRRYDERQRARDRYFGTQSEAEHQND
jgi:hypothetical protein